MLDDLISRLRRRIVPVAYPDGSTKLDVDFLCVEAADEIERLRAELIRAYELYLREVGDES